MLPRSLSHSFLGKRRTFLEKDLPSPRLSFAHCSYLDIYISQNIGLSEGDLKANFKPAYREN